LPFEEEISMTLLTITSKGQVTLKKELLRQLGVGPGDRLEAQVTANGSAVLRPVRAQESIADSFGMFGEFVGEPVSIEEMNQIAAEGWAGQL
jgi:bifunctional DNA-binding transcriptional regulator/antitoxin component of YhaV-PrlF toxin-antitoxin module